MINSLSLYFFTFKGKRGYTEAPFHKHAYVMVHKQKTEFVLGLMFPQIWHAAVLSSQQAALQVLPGTGVAMGALGTGAP